MFKVNNKYTRKTSQLITTLKDTSLQTKTSQLEASTMQKQSSGRVL